MNSLNALGSAHLGKIDGSAASNAFGSTPNLLDPTQMAGNASFAALFAGITNATTPAVPGTDPLAQLTALVQNGTPMSSIIDRLAQQLAGAVQSQLPASGGATSAVQLRTSLAKTIAKALSPPGNAPPGTAAEQVAGLAQRLRSWIATLAGSAEKQSGQQNDIAGNLLDAKPAKDIPAQSKSSSESIDIDPAVLARALLTSLSAALSGGTTNASSPASFSAALSAGNAPVNVPSANVPSAPAGAPVSVASAADDQSAASSAQITMSNAPDLLARMLVRAAGVDAQVNGGSTQGSTGVPSGGTDSTPSALAARFASVLATIAANATGSESQSNSNGSSFGREFSQQSADKASTASNSSQAFGASIATTPPVSSSSLTAQPPAAASLVDANAVIEQVVKSMVMRTNESGTSEIRLRLNPDNLGEVSMKLTVSGSSISANILAQNGDVRNALMANQQQLAQTLSEAGLTLAGFSVDVSGGDAGRDRDTKDRTAGFGRRYVVHEIGGASDEPQSAQLSSLGPQILSNSSLDLFNYLV